ncbi:hypothetical protein HZA41_01645 [Candidatus Peregrinibacteria bacterium]|nr:hypothetical protein [Candidatus Peregrinibacteria bacterium]
MILSLDFGASTVDSVRIKNGTICTIKTFESLDIATHDLSAFFRESGEDITGISRIRVTGGKSRIFPDEVFGISVSKVDEIEAIGRGGVFLFREESGVADGDFLVVSMGTGTCMVHVRATKGKLMCRHIGGTGVGGGTFLGLSREMLGETDIPHLLERFRRGDARKVDLSVGDIVGSGIGMISADVTASHFGKLARPIDFHKNDLAAGIVNFIGQTIGVLAVFSAASVQAKHIILTGKLTRIEEILDIILSIGKMYSVKMVVPKNAEYVSAVGAGM